MKFLVDIPISPKTVLYLKSLGFDAVHLSSIGKECAADVEIIQIAKEQDRIIISMDLGFGAILAHSGLTMPGVILFRVQYATPEKINSLLENLLNTINRENLKNSIVSVDDVRIRIRKLPL